MKLTEGLFYINMRAWMERAVKGRWGQETLKESVSIGIKKNIRNSIVLETIICIRGMAVEYSTAVLNTCRGNKL